VVERSDTTGEPSTRQRPALQPWGIVRGSCPWGILPQPPRFVLGLEWEWVAVVERSDTTGESLKGDRPMFLARSAPATRRLAGRVRVAVVERNDTTGELGTRPGPEFLGHTTPYTRPPPAGELALQKPLAQRLSRRYDHQR